MIQHNTNHKRINMSKQPDFALFSQMFKPKLEAQLKKAPNNQKILKELGNIYRFEGNLDAAGKMFKRLAELDVNDQYSASLSSILNDNIMHPNHDFEGSVIAPIVKYPNFFSKENRQKIVDFANQQQQEFVNGQVHYRTFKDGGTQDKDIINEEFRQQKNIDPSPEILQMLKDAILPLVPEVITKIGMKYNHIYNINTEIARTGHNQFCNAHSDRVSDTPRMSTISFLYYFHQQPKQFEGGDIIVYDTLINEKNAYNNQQGTRIIHEDNLLMAFPACFFHEITKVTLPNDRFDAGRFAIPFWVMMD